MSSKKLSLTLIFSIVLTLGLSISLGSLLAAWTTPTSAPPEGNIAEPLNRGSGGQDKLGGLILNTGGDTNGLIVQSGNVGIGTTDPQAMLDVAGNIIATTPTASSHLTTKDYVDNAVAAAGGGGLEAADIWTYGARTLTVPTVIRMGDCVVDHAIGIECGGGKKFVNGLVAMPSGCDGSTFNPTCGGADTVQKKWATTVSQNEPAGSTTNGEINTVNLVNDSQRVNAAALYCYDLVVNGYDDWFLPAKSQLTTLYNQRSAMGGFAYSSYWSSTELNAWRADFINFSNGYDGFYYNQVWKWANQYVRCIRSY